MTRRLDRGPLRDRRLARGHRRRGSARSRSDVSTLCRMVPSTFGFGDSALVGFAVLGVAFASVGALLVDPPARATRSAGCMVLIGDGYALGIV